MGFKHAFMLALGLAVTVLGTSVATQAYPASR